MQYCATVNTASPATGLITVGEVLTERQKEALGEKKLEELVRDGVLRIMRDTPPAPASGEEAKPDAEQDNKPNAEDEGEDLPVLEATDEIVAAEKREKRRKRGSAKGKEERD